MGASVPGFRFWGSWVRGFMGRSRFATPHSTHEPMNLCTTHEPKNHEPVNPNPSTYAPVNP
jgi:hypothetical protein